MNVRERYRLARPLLFALILGTAIFGLITLYLAVNVIGIIRGDGEQIVSSAFVLVFSFFLLFRMWRVTRQTLRDRRTIKAQRRRRSR